MRAPSDEHTEDRSRQTEHAPRDPPDQSTRAIGPPGAAIAHRGQTQWSDPHGARAGKHDLDVESRGRRGTRRQAERNLERSRFRISFEGGLGSLSSQGLREVPGAVWEHAPQLHEPRRMNASIPDVTTEHVPYVADRRPIDRNERERSTDVAGSDLNGSAVDHARERVGRGPIDGGDGPSLRRRSGASRAPDEDGDHEPPPRYVIPTTTHPRPPASSAPG